MPGRRSTNSLQPIRYTMSFNFTSRIYDLMQESRGLLAERPALTWYGECVSEVPERPYVCKSCDRTFVHLSGLMQHQV